LLDKDLSTTISTNHDSLILTNLSHNRIISIMPEENIASPGSAIQKELDARGWNQTDLAQILGVHQSVVSSLVTGKRPISLEIARDLAAAFSTELAYWLKLETDFRLFAVGPVDDGISRRARLFEAAPVKEMIRRRWIQSTTDIDLLEKQILGFYGASSLDELTNSIPKALRKSSSYVKETASERFWLQRVRQLAPAAPVSAKYSDTLLAGAMKKFKGFLGHPESVRHIPKVLADAGIRFVIVENLPRTGIDGVCLWLDKSSPVIALSLFRDRMDSVWFTLFHEMDHVKNRDGLMLPPVVDSRLTGEDSIHGSEKPEAEKRADLFASTSLIPAEEMDDFIIRIGPLYSKPRIEGFASRIGVHPSIVLGQLQYRKEMDWNQKTDLIGRVRDILTHEAPTDGWGMSAILPAAV
jgi:HTH-type transcriptional regulator/antitoxin HigA